MGGVGWGGLTPQLSPSLSTSLSHHSLTPPPPPPPSHPGADSLPQRVVEDAFRPLHGRVINHHQFSDAIRALQEWYERRGHFGQVVDVEMQGSVAEVRGDERYVMCT